MERSFVYLREKEHSNMDNHEYLKRLNDVLMKFPHGAKMFTESGLFHNVTMMLINDQDPHVVIEELVKIIEESVKNFENYIKGDTRSVFTIVEKKIKSKNSETST